MRTLLTHKNFALLSSLVLTFAACGSSGGGGPHDGGGGSGGSTGSGGSGGAAGTGGSTGSGGSTGAGGSTGTGGSAGTGGSGGSGGTAGSTGDSGATKFPAGTICNSSGSPIAAPATIDHVIVILMENEDLGSVVGNANAPYINSIATACGYASNYLDNEFTGHNLVSSPHYLALTSGSNCDTGLTGGGGSTSGCITDDNDATSHTLSTMSIFAQASSWKAYEEDMPSNCDQSSSGNYATKHNPAAYYSTLSSCGASDIPITSVSCGTSKMTSCGSPSNQFTTDLAAGTLPAFSFITPNLINDMHNGFIGSQQVAHGDNWLYTYLPLIFASTEYLNGKIAIFVLWDEQNSLTYGGTTPNFFVSPYITAGTVSSTTVNHFSSLLAIENMLGISTHLGCAGGTPPGGSGTCPTGSTADLRAAIGF